MLTMIYWMFTTKCDFINPKLVFQCGKIMHISWQKNDILNQQKYEDITVFNEM